MNTNYYDYIGATGEHPINDYINITSNINYNYTSNSSNILNSNITITSNSNYNYTSNSSNDITNNTWHVNSINPNCLINYNYDDFYLYGAIHTNIYIDEHPNSKLIFRPRYNNQGSDHKLEIRKDGKLYIYLQGNLLPPISSGWYNLNDELQTLFIVNTGQDTAISTIASDIVAINGTLTLFATKIANLTVLDTALGYYTTIKTQLDNFATWQYVVGGVVGTIGIAGAYTAVTANTAGNLANMINASFVSSNALIGILNNCNINSNERYLLSNQMNEIITSNNLLICSNNLALNVNQGFINCNLNFTQFIPSLNTNEIKINNTNLNNIYITSNVLLNSSLINKSIQSNINFNYPMIYDSNDGVSVDGFSSITYNQEPILTNSTISYIDNSNYYCIFNNNGSITFNNNFTCDILVVGAGGNGGLSSNSGGGGAGEIYYNSNYLFTSGTYNINVGSNSIDSNFRISKIYKNSTDLIKVKGGGDGGSYYYNLTYQVFNYSGTIETFNIPLGVSLINVYCWGAGGGSTKISSRNTSGIGGTGGFIKATLNVSSISTLKIVVGQGGKKGLSNSLSGNAFGGGGTGHAGNAEWFIGGGGGLSGIFANNANMLNSYQVNTNSTAILVAGAGGSGGANDTSVTTTINNGGNGGSEIANGSTGECIAGGGTQTTGGVGSGGTKDGSKYLGGNAVNFSGGGGGGWYGGGTLNTTAGGKVGGGGGGSSYINTSSYTITNITNSKNTTNGTTTAPGNNEIYYQSGIAIGGVNNSGTLNNGGNGLIVIEYYIPILPTSGGSGGGGAENQNGALAGIKWDNDLSIVYDGNNGTSIKGGDGGGLGFLTNIINNNLTIGTGGTGANSTNSPIIKTKYGDGGDGNGGLGFNGVVIIKSTKTKKLNYNSYITSFNQIEDNSNVLYNINSNLNLTSNNLITKINNNSNVLNTTDINTSNNLINYTNDKSTILNIKINNSSNDNYNFNITNSNQIYSLRGTDEMILSILDSDYCKKSTFLISTNNLLNYNSVNYYTYTIDLTKYIRYIQISDITKLSRFKIMASLASSVAVFSYLTECEYTIMMSQSTSIGQTGGFHCRAFGIPEDLNLTKFEPYKFIKTNNIYQLSFISPVQYAKFIITIIDLF